MIPRTYRRTAREIQQIDAAKERAGIPTPVIEQGIPAPKGFWRSDGQLASLRMTMATMEVEHSFMWHECSAVYIAAREVGIRIKIRKMNGKGWRVWRTE